MQSGLGRTNIGLWGFCSECAKLRGGRDDGSLSMLLNPRLTTATREISLSLSGSTSVESLGGGVLSATVLLLARPASVLVDRTALE